MSKHSRRLVRCVAHSSALLALVSVPGAAQSARATIPIAVAKAMTLAPEIFGRPQFFNGRTPPQWPAALTPRGVRVLGGGVIGDLRDFNDHVAVFEFSPGSNPAKVLTEVVRRAGFTNPARDFQHRDVGGFADTHPPSKAYCNDALQLASFAPVDSASSMLVYAVVMLEGESARISCGTSSSDPYAMHFPVTVPQLLPPAGTQSFGGGSSWGGSSGHMTTSLRTTMPTDSILEHYSAQLIKAGWTAEGRGANADGVGFRRFSFHEGIAAWSAALIVQAAGDRREVTLNLVRSE